MPNITYAFGLFLREGKKLIGVCTYGHPFSSQLKKSVVGYESKMFELNRLVVNDGLPRNTLSWFVGQTFKQLPKPMALVSYSDTERNHHGYIYQATNWLYTGLSTPFMDYVIKGYEDLHNQSICDSVGRADRNPNVAGKSRLQLLKDRFGEDNVMLKECSRKHRYFYFLGDKRQKRAMRKALTYEIVDEYPKGKNWRYDASYKPVTQKFMDL